MACPPRFHNGLLDSAGVNAITFAGYRTVEHEDVPEPSLEAPTDVIVKVELAGICGSDLHPYHEREEGLDYGAVMGHEFVGEIVEAGARGELGTDRRSSLQPLHHELWRLLLLPHRIDLSLSARSAVWLGW